MMEPADFASRWNEYAARTGNTGAMPLITLVSPDARAPAQAVQFLTEAGLPQDWSGPFTFDLAESLRRVGDVFGWHGQSGDWNRDVYRRLSRYVYLGFDGGDNPICLDSTDQDRVVFLDHESFLDPDLRGQFINSGIAELAECVLIFQEMVEDYRREQGEAVALYDGNVPANLVEQALSKMRRADPEAFAEGAYRPGAFEGI